MDKLKGAFRIPGCTFFAKLLNCSVSDKICYVLA